MANQVCNARIPGSASKFEHSGHLNLIRFCESAQVDPQSIQEMSGLFNSKKKVIVIYRNVLKTAFLWHVIFQYGRETVRIQQILIGFEAVQWYIFYLRN